MRAFLSFGEPLLNKLSLVAKVGLILGSSISLAAWVTMVALWLACCLLDGEDQGLIPPNTNSFFTTICRWAAIALRKVN